MLMDWDSKFTLHYWSELCRLKLNRENFE